METIVGKFIVFEGPDGSGESTQAKLLADYLNTKGYSVLLTKEPYEATESGKEIRRLLREHTPMDPLARQLLFVKNRTEHLREVIEPALRQGKIVISDRYFFSTIAFGSLGCDLKPLTDITAHFPLPDLTIILDVSAEECMRRIKGRGTPQELFEKEEKLKKVRETYLHIATRYKGVYLVDGERPVSEVFEDVKAKVEALF